MLLYGLFDKSYKLSLEDKLIINKYNNTALAENEKSYDFDGEEKKCDYNGLEKNFNNNQSSNKKDSDNLVGRGEAERVITKSDQNNIKNNDTIKNNNLSRNFQVIIGNKKTKDSKISKRNKQIYNVNKRHNEKYFKNSSINSTNIFTSTIDDIYARMKSFILKILSRIKW